jgi:hypothetical protein
MAQAGCGASGTVQLGLYRLATIFLPFGPFHQHSDEELEVGRMTSSSALLLSHFVPSSCRKVLFRQCLRQHERLCPTCEAASESTVASTSCDLLSFHDIRQSRTSMYG